MRAFLLRTMALIVLRAFFLRRVPADAGPLLLSLLQRHASGRWRCRLRSAHFRFPATAVRASRSSYDDGEHPGGTCPSCRRRLRSLCLGDERLSELVVRVHGAPPAAIVSEITYGAAPTGLCRSTAERPARALAANGSTASRSSAKLSA